MPATEPAKNHLYKEVVFCYHCFMRKHFIILGAGASYDYIDEDYISPEMRSIWHRFRPPLAVELFSPSRFNKILNKHEEASHLASSVLSAIKQGKDIEEFLQELRERGGHRKNELVSTLYYLADLFQQVSDEIGVISGNNYSNLIGKIKDNGGQACIVTFNYDHLLEMNLGLQLDDSRDSINRYINNPIQVIKIHGSCEWSYLSGPYADYDIERISLSGGIDSHLTQNPELVFEIGSRNSVPDIVTKRNFEKHFQDEWQDDVAYYSYPALAMPMRTKHSYVCPKSHIEEMKASLLNVSKILIIGWKAADENLLNVLEEIIQHPVEFTIVGSKNVAVTKSRILKKVPKATFKLFDGGFTNFMSSEKADNFFEPNKIQKYG